MASPWRGVITEYRDRLPVPDHVDPISLGEGGTPLVEATAIGDRIGAKVYLKVEGANPTGSFKDRGMTVAMTKVAHDKAKLVMCASTGNTSASAAAYAVRAGIPCAVVLPAGKIAAGKLAQAVVHGATLLGVDGSFDDCLTVVQQLDQQFDIAMVNSINPYRLQGQKTAAFEVVDQLGQAPDIHALPVGNAGNITAYWMGYNEYAGRTVTTTMEDSATTLAPVSETVPQMWGFQADGAAPLVKGAAVEFPETIATAIRIGNPAAWKWAEAARDNSGGRIEAVTDSEILDAQRMIAAEAGVFVEPASAASVAGVLSAAKRGEVKAGSTIVCTVTGNGLKDTATALGAATGDLAGAKGETPSTFEPQMIEPTAEAAAKVLGLV